MLQLDHKKMKAWQKGIELNIAIFLLCKKLPETEKFNLSSQMRRATLSVTNNIAEGAARKSSLERKRFYEISRSSIVEVDSCLEVALALKYLLKEEIILIENLIEEIFKLLSTMIKNT